MPRPQQQRATQLKRFAALLLIDANGTGAYDDVQLLALLLIQKAAHLSRRIPRGPYNAI